MPATPERPDRQPRLVQLQRLLHELREGLARNKEQVELFVKIEIQRPLTADERQHMRTVRLETERLRLELRRLREEFEQLRS